MSALSYRHMNYTLQVMEHEQARRDAAWYASLPAEEKAEKIHYWFIERKAKRGRKWIFVRDFVGTKREAADLFCTWFRNRPDRHRLRHQLTY